MVKGRRGCTPTTTSGCASSPTPRNQAETRDYSVEKPCVEHGDKVDAEVKSTIETAASELRSALEGDDAEGDPHAAHRRSHEASYKLAEVVYQNSGASGGTAEGGSAPSDEAEEEVIEDAEIVDEGDHARS